MPIVYEDSSRQFHLFNEEVSYIIKILDNEQLGNLYYGKKIRNRKDFSHLFERSKRDMAAYIMENDSTFSLEHIRQEYPTFGTGDMRVPAFEIEWDSGSRVVNFTYRDYQIIKGKPAIEGLPACYAESEDEATTLIVELEDKEEEAGMYLSYTIYEKRPVITKNVRFINCSKKRITLHSAMSGCLDLPDSQYVMIDMPGAWGRERRVCERNLEYGIQSVYSRRGSSSYMFNPFIALKRKGADENAGEVLGFSLVYSGNFIAQVEVDNYEVARVLMGIHPGGFKWSLESGDEFQTPELIMAYSDEGLNRMSHVFHDLFRNRLVRGEWRDKERPILINSWEALYFDFNEEKLLALAKAAIELGIELFVLDDGWFGERENDEKSLGDWYPNRGKFPNGLKGVAKKIHQMGMQFGLWIEPEMVNKDSNLYRAHPEWVLGEQGKRLSHSRNQYVLDFSKEEVVEYIYEQIHKVIRDVDADYIKWDMNRTFGEVYSNGKQKTDQGKIYHRYILGVYRLYDRLTRDFPKILFESCASGGARFDSGMLYYAPQGWISDNTDAVDRLKIQYGTSYVYPPVCMGCHVSASPNHQTGRATSLKMRGDVACFGTFGYELDLTLLSQEEREEIKEQVSFVKRYRNLILTGDFYRLKNPFAENIVAWMLVSKDKKQAVVGYYRILQPVNGGFERLRLQGLLDDMEYEIEDYSVSCYGDELMRIGLITSDSAAGVVSAGVDRGDFKSRIYELKGRNKV